jgi:hypothetical protein
LGASSLWRFICGYNSVKQAGVPFSLLFLVLPIIFRKDMCELISGTYKSSGLSKFAEKFFQNRQNDRLCYINNAIEEYKSISLNCIRVGLGSNLFSIDLKTSLIYPKTKTDKIDVSSSTRKILKASEKLGNWYADLTLYEICTLLKVRF